MVEWKIGDDYAECTWRDPYFREASIELAAGDDAFTVEIKTGSGYSAQSTSAPIPVRVIKRLLENAGYTVTPDTSGTGQVTENTGETK